MLYRFGTTDSVVTFDRNIAVTCVRPQIALAVTPRSSDDTVAAG